MKSLADSLSTLQKAIMYEDKNLTKKASKEISHSKLQPEKPWLIMESFQHEEFKKDINNSDLNLHQMSDAIIKHSTKPNWTKAQKVFNQLSLTCIKCHTRWKSEATDISLKVAKHEHTHTKDLNSSFASPIYMIRDLPRRDIP